MTERKRLYEHVSILHTLKISVMTSENVTEMDTVIRSQHPTA